MGHKDYDAPELTKGKSFNDGCDICSIGLIMPFKLPYNSYLDNNNNICRASKGNTLMINENPDKRVLEELKKIEKKILFYNKEKSLVISLFTCIFNIEELKLELIKKLN